MQSISELYIQQQYLKEQSLLLEMKMLGLDPMKFIDKAKSLFSMKKRELENNIKLLGSNYKTVKGLADKTLLGNKNIVKNLQSKNISGFKKEFQKSFNEFLSGVAKHFDLNSENVSKALINAFLNTALNIGFTFLIHFVITSFIFPGLGIPIWMGAFQGHGPMMMNVSIFVSSILVMPFINSYFRLEANRQGNTGLFNLFFIPIDTALSAMKLSIMGITLTFPKFLALALFAFSQLLSTEADKISGEGEDKETKDKGFMDKIFNIVTDGLVGVCFNIGANIIGMSTASIFEAIVTGGGIMGYPGNIKIQSI